MSKIFIFVHIQNESKSQISLGHDLSVSNHVVYKIFNEWFQRVHILIGMEKYSTKYDRLKNK